MPTIKRYANRKLYDTEAKRYVTLEDLAAFVRRGEDLRVLDHASGEDLTSQTLFQIIFEEEKKIGGLLPQVFLTKLIRAGGSRLGALRSRLISLDPFQTVDEEIRRRVQSLVEQGLLGAEEAARLQNLLIHRTSAPGAVNIRVTAEDAASDAGAEGAEEVPPDAAASAGWQEEEPADAEAVNALMKQVEALEEQLRLLKNH